MTSKPWKSGPTELLNHAMEHIRAGGDFDHRIAMISIDNAVELGIRTFLGLPRRVRGSEGPSRKELDSATSSFPDLLDLLERYGSDRLGEVELGDVEVYHRLRNTLYHEGNGVTVDRQHVDGYLQIARILLKNLLEADLEDIPAALPQTLLGDFISAWGALEARVRYHLQHREPALERGSLSQGVEALARSGFLPSDFAAKFRTISSRRNQIVHGVSTVETRELKGLVAQVKDLIDQVPGANC